MFISAICRQSANVGHLYVNNLLLGCPRILSRPEVSWAIIRLSLLSMIYQCCNVFYLSILTCFEDLVTTQSRPVIAWWGAEIWKSDIVVADMKRILKRMIIALHETILKTWRSKQIIMILLRVMKYCAFIAQFVQITVHGNDTLRKRCLIIHRMDWKKIETEKKRTHWCTISMTCRLKWLNRTLPVSDAVHGLGAFVSGREKRPSPCVFPVGPQGCWTPIIDQESGTRASLVEDRPTGGYCVLDEETDRP